MVVQAENSIIESSFVQVTDVNVDCLEHIFKHLIIDDLVSIASANSWFRVAAGWTFAHKFGKKTVTFKDISTIQKCRVGMSENGILIRDLRNCLRLLRCFGHLITKLEISHLLVAKKYQAYINQYISKYCINLAEITFSSCTEETFAVLKNVFKSVEKVRFVNCYLGSKMSQLTKLFPNCRSLEFDGLNEVFDRTCIAANFQKMEHFAVNLVASEKYGFGKKNVVKAIKLNSNTLKSLHIHWDNDKQFFNHVNQLLKSLHTFKFDCSENDLPKIHDDDDVVHFNSVKNFQMSLIDSTWYTNAIAVHWIPFKFDALENFIFESDKKMGPLFFDFIEKHPTITKLTLCNFYKWQILDVNDQHMDKIAETLPSLIEVDIKTFSFSGRQALGFVNKLKNLRQFQFTLEYPESFVGLMKRLPEWRGTIDAKHYVRLTHVGDMNKKVSLKRIRSKGDLTEKTSSKRLH